MCSFRRRGGRVGFLFFNKHADALGSLWALLSGSPCLLALVYSSYRFNSSLVTLRLNLQQACVWLCKCTGGLSAPINSQSWEAR